MASYKCGYCGKYNVDDIWCSEDHRQLWYAERRVDAGVRIKERPGRLGPKGRVEGGRRGTRKARAKKS